MELFKLRAKVDIEHIPYKGSGPAMADLLGGHVKLMMDRTASALGAIRDGRIKALAVTTATPRAGAARHHSVDRRDDPGLRCRRLVGPRRAGADAARDRRQDQPRRAGAAARARE